MTTYAHRNGEFEPPTENGWYWVDTLEPIEGGQKFEIAKVHEDDVNGACFWVVNHEGMLHSKYFLSCRWYGPLAPPRDEQ